MNNYNVAYLNWKENIIQFSEEEAESALEAMKEMDGLYKFGHIKNEEEYFKAVEKCGGFIAYEQIVGE